MKKSLLLLGAGGHCASILGTLYRLGIYDEICIVGLPQEVGGTVLDSPVIATDRDLPALYQKGFREGFLALGSLGNPDQRVRIFHTLRRLGFVCPVIQNPSATVSPGAEIGEGTFLSGNVYVGPQAQIGAACILNSGAIVEHHCQIGAFAHIAPGSTLCGNVKVGAYSHIGAGAVVLQNQTVGENTLIGAGSVVTRPIASGVVALGSPCKFQRLQENCQ